MIRTIRRGLRAELLLSLFVAVVLAFGLLDAVAVRLTERARVQERVEAAHAAAAMFAEVAGQPNVDATRLDRVADALVRRNGIVGVEVHRDGRPLYVRGTPGTGEVAEALGAAGLVVRMHVDTRESEGGRRNAQFLFLYVALTAGGILVLTYVVLTFVVVRPIDQLTKASERLATSRGPVSVDEGGPRELATLGRTFNHMAKQLADDRRALEERLEELERTTHELRLAQDQVVRAAKLASVGRLAAGVAHEIGNPLAAILGLVGLVEEGDLPPDEQAEFVRRIRKETERIHGILRDLLDFSRMETSDDAGAGRGDARAAVREALALVRPQRAVRGVTLRAEPDAEPVPDVALDEPRLVQVVLNLLLNAADAVGASGTVEVFVRAAGDHVEVVVEDDGPGIDPAVASSLFEPFVTTKPVGQGTGLGLAVCHTIVQRAGGSIEVAPRSPRGTRFVVRLPLARPGA